MRMTKRDIADIVLVWVVFSTLFHFLTSLVPLLAWAVLPPGSTEAKNVIATFGFMTIYVLVLLLLCYLLLFKRAAILSFLFPDAGEKELSIPAGMDALVSYAFWLRLFGVYICISSAISFFGYLATSAVMDWQFGNTGWYLRNSMPSLISAVLAGLVVWKAEWIAAKVPKMITSDEARPNDIDAENS